MLIFIDSQGNVVGRTPGGLTQGSSKANVLQLVAPFPTAIASVSFQLPNGIVLGPKLEDELGETANEYVMTEAFKIPGYGVGGSELTVFNFTCNKQITALSGTLGIQFFLSVGEIEDPEGSPSYGGYTIAVDLINIPVYNGTRFIPYPPLTADNTDFYTDLLEKVSNILAVAYSAKEIADDAKEIAEDIASSAVLKDPEPDAQGNKTQHVQGEISSDKIHAKSGIFSDDLFAYAIKSYLGLHITGSSPLSALLFSSGTGANYSESGIYAKDIGGKVAGLVLYGTLFEMLGDLTVEGDANVGGSLTAEGNANVAGSLTAEDNAKFLSDVEIDGNLTVNGTTTTVDHETLIVNDNIIVTNSDGLSQSVSGLVINIGNGKGYGILYETSSGNVCIGEGDLSTTGDEPTFAFTWNKKFPIATRTSEGLWSNGAIPVYDASNETFKSSGKDFSDFVSRNEAKQTINGEISVENGINTISLSLINSGTLLGSDSNGSHGLILNDGDFISFNAQYQAGDPVVIRTIDEDINGDPSAVGLHFIGEKHVFDGTVTFNAPVTVSFDQGQALPLAARSENFPNGEIPIFDAATASFKPSGKTTESFVQRYVNPDTTMKVYAAGSNADPTDKMLYVKTGFAGNEGVDSIVLRGDIRDPKHPGTFEVQPPVMTEGETGYSSKHPMTVGVAEDRYVKRTNQTSHIIAYTNYQGVEEQMEVQFNVVGDRIGYYSIACRNPEGCITVNDPINPLDAVNKRTLDNALANLPTGGSGGLAWSDTYDASKTLYGIKINEIDEYDSEYDIGLTLPENFIFYLNPYSDNNYYEPIGFKSDYGFTSVDLFLVNSNQMEARIDGSVSFYLSIKQYLQ